MKNCNKKNITNINKQQHEQSNMYYNENLSYETHPLLLSQSPSNQSNQEILPPIILENKLIEEVTANFDKFKENGSMWCSSRKTVTRQDKDNQFIGYSYKRKKDVIRAVLNNSIFTSPDLQINDAVNGDMNDAVNGYLNEVMSGGDTIDQSIIKIVNDV